MTRPRVQYKTFVVERTIACRRDAAWAALVAFLDEIAPGGAQGEIAFRLDAWQLTERTLSFEPPWRRVYEVVDGAPVKLYQATTALRDDGRSTHLVWSYLCEPLEGDASDAFLARAQQAITAAADLVAARAAARAGSTTAREEPAPG